MSLRKIIEHFFRDAFNTLVKVSKSLFNSIGMINKYNYINHHYKDIEKQILNNFDAIEYQLDCLDFVTDREGIVFSKCIDSDSDNKFKNSYQELNIEDFSFTNNPNVSGFIKNGTYEIDIKNLSKDRMYIMTITPRVGNVNSYSDGKATIDKNLKAKVYTDGSYDKSGNLNKSGITTDVEIGIKKDSYDLNGEKIVDDFVPGLYNNNINNNKPGTRLRYMSAPPYVQRKQSTDIEIWLDDDYLIAKTIGGEFCEISSMHQTYFEYFVKGEGWKIRPRLSLKSGYSVHTGASWGGKGYNEYPISIKFQTGDKNSVKLTLIIDDLLKEENKTGKGFNTILEKEHDDLSCLSNLLIEVETHWQDRPINNSPLDDENKNNPELDFDDGGERYYEPWKFLFDEEVIDSDGNNTWFRKWRTWFRNKVRKHNELVDSGNKDEDLDAWKEDNSYKKEHI